MDRAEATRLDDEDPLRSYRERFWIPPSPAHDDGRPAIYLCGNSLGLQPKAVRPALEQELDDWAHLGVEGHFAAKSPWLPYHGFLRDAAAGVVGGQPNEVVVMNSLTVNLHLLMVSFYRPAGDRRRILIDLPCFPSDVYAVKSQLRFHGHDPEQDLLTVGPREGEDVVRTEDVLELLEREGDRVALVLLGGVNYFTGQLLDIPRITKAAHERGCLVGVDLAHAAGNVDLRLHDWDVDFAAWCSYKYLNSGPGSLAGAFVHERHLGGAGGEAFERFKSLPRFEGWWGNDPETRFAMEPAFVPVTKADAWQLSNPPILAMAPVRVSLEIFAEAGMAALRAKSVQLTAYLERLVLGLGSESFRIITPSEPEARGCQLSILVETDPKKLLEALEGAGIVCDFRRPNVIRVAPVPLYNTFQDVWAFAQALKEVA